jgi:hypothetical protein
MAVVANDALVAEFAYCANSAEFAFCALSAAVAVATAPVAMMPFTVSVKFVVSDAGMDGTVVSHGAPVILPAGIVELVSKTRKPAGELLAVIATTASGTVTDGDRFVAE